MATKNTSTSIPSKPAPAQESHRQPDFQKSNNSNGGRVLSENTRQTTVFQTRPTPPDPNKK